MSDDQKPELPDLSADESAYAEPVRGGFNPQPDPPKTLKATDPSQIGLLLPAVQKVREA